MLGNPEINAVMEREFGGSNRETAKLSMPCNCMPGKSIDLQMSQLMTNAKMTDQPTTWSFFVAGWRRPSSQSTTKSSVAIWRTRSRTWSFSGTFGIVRARESVHL